MGLARSQGIHSPKPAASKWPTTLFPLPRNRKRTPTDAETLLHALAIGIRDHATHAELRRLIGFLPRIRNRVSPYTATAKENFELQERVGALEQALQKLRRRKPALTAEGEQTLGGVSGSFVMGWVADTGSAGSVNQGNPRMGKRAEATGRSAGEMKTEEQSAYPLSWPRGWARTKNPTYSRFGHRGKPPSTSQGSSAVLAELSRMGASRHVVISTNVELRLDGLPYSNRKEPTDKGVAVYFTLNGKPKVHPDKKGGSEEAFDAVVKAKDMALQLINQ